MRTLLILFMLWSLCSPSPRSYIRQYRFPEVVFEIQEITGSCSKEEINAVVDNEMLALRSIYFKYLEKNKKSLADGNILFKFTISKNGEITKADIIH
ncbi:MAG: hypothetical protein LBU89_00645, partial [Fibromonadaceae bacterium]|nr:hypothetical protein [Fibromonadaceae bacterium]